MIFIVLIYVFFIPINKSIATFNSYSVVHIMLKLGNERDLEI